MNELRTMLDPDNQEQLIRKIQDIALREAAHAVVAHVTGCFWIESRIESSYAQGCIGSTCYTLSNRPRPKGAARRAVGRQKKVPFAGVKYKGVTTHSRPKGKMEAAMIGYAGVAAVKLRGDFNSSADDLLGDLRGLHLYLSDADGELIKGLHASLRFRAARQSIHALKTNWTLVTHLRDCLARRHLEHVGDDSYPIFYSTVVNLS